MQVCILSTNYAFEYPHGDYVYPFKVLATELSKRGVFVTVLCLGPNLDILRDNVRLRAVAPASEITTLRAFDKSLQVWQYYACVRQALIDELAVISAGTKYDVVESCGVTFDQYIHELGAALVLRLTEPQLPALAPDEFADINLALLRARQREVAPVAQSLLDEQGNGAVSQSNLFPSDSRLEGLVFSLLNVLPEPILPKNSMKSILLGRWFMDSAETRQLALSALVELRKRGINCRLLYPCDCNWYSYAEKEHEDAINTARNYVASELGDSGALWIIHNLGSSDMLACLSCSDLVLMPTSGPHRMYEIDSVGFASCFYGKPVVPIDAIDIANATAGVEDLGTKLSAALSGDMNESSLRLADATKEHLNSLVQARIRAYESARSSRNQASLTTFVDDVGSILRGLESNVRTTAASSTISGRLRYKLRNVFTSSGQG